MATNYARTTIGPTAARRVSALARSVSRQAGRLGHRCARASMKQSNAALSLPSSSVGVPAGPLSRSGGWRRRSAASGQPEHLVRGRDPGLRLPAVGLLQAPIRNVDLDRSRHPLGVAARLHARRNRSDPVHAEKHPGLRHRQSRNAENALNSTANSSRRTAGARAPDTSPANPTSAPSRPGMPPVYQRAIALIGRQIEAESEGWGG